MNKLNLLINSIADQINLIARIFLASGFLLAGYDKFLFFPDWVEYVSSQHLPSPYFLALIFCFFELIGGIALVLGFQTRFVAFWMAILSAISACFYHDFWNAPSDTQLFQMVIFMKDLGISGGLLMVMVMRPNQLCLDYLWLVKDKKRSD